MNQARRYWDEDSTPLFPFGYGLSYARFEYADLILDTAGLNEGQSLTASVTVTNASDRDGDEVVQLYLHQRHGTASRPVRELKGFRRIHLEAGASQTVEFSIGPNELRYWNAGVRDFVLDASTFDVWVGGDSTAQLTPRSPPRRDKPRLRGLSEVPRSGGLGFVLEAGSGRARGRSDRW